MDADRPDQPVDPADPTVAQLRRTGPDRADQEGPADRPAPPPGVTDVLRKPPAGEGATEVFRAPPKPVAPAAPTAPAAPAAWQGAGGFGGQQAGPAVPPRQPGPGFGAPPANPGYPAPSAPVQANAPYGGQYGPPGPPQGHRPTQTFDPVPGPPAAPQPQPKRKGRLVALVAAGVVLLAALGVGGFFLLRPTYVDPEIAKAEVVRATQKTDELTATDVRCPDDAEQKQGGTFTCTATVVGKQISYTVTQNNDEGTVFSVTYERPVLDPDSVKQEIVKSTRSEFGVEPTDITCPDEVHYDKNATFTCTAKLESQPLNYTITQTDGLGAVSVAHGRVLKSAEIAKQIADALTKQVGAEIVVQCGQSGQTLIVNEPGTTIECRAAATANPSRVVPVPVKVDRSGTVYPA